MGTPMDVSRLVYALLALAAGGMIAAQAPINARLRVALGTPTGSALVSFLVGAALLLLVVALVGEAGDLGAVGAGPWWAYLGGLLGAVFVVVTLLAAPRIGVTTTFVAVVLGQVVAAGLIDRFGWLGQEAVSLSWERIAAGVLLLASVVLLLRA